MSAVLREAHHAGLRLSLRSPVRLESDDPLWLERDTGIDSEAADIFVRCCGQTEDAQLY